MHIYWYGRCFLCECPLDIEYDPDGDHEDRYLDQFEEFHPADIMRRDIDLSGNLSIWKRFGHRTWERVCSACFELKLHHNPKILGQREIGARRMHRPRTVSMTMGELQQYVFMMQRFFRKRRIEEGV